MNKNNKIELLVLPSVKNIEEITKNINVKVTKAYYTELEFIFKNNKASILHNGRDINSFSAVWLSSYWSTRDIATAIKQYLDSYNIPTTHVESGTSKLTDAMGFSLENIPTPDTYFLKYTQTLHHLDDIEKICGFPVIMKTTKGFGGLNAKFIKSKKELIAEIESRNKNYEYMFQRFIPNDYDWGIMVVNGKVVSGERSYPKSGEFRNNHSIGATEIFADIETIPEEVKEIAINGAKALGLSWSRSDIVVDKTTKQPYLLEVNRFPGITSKTTEVSGAREFIKNYLDINGLLPKEMPDKESSLLPNLKIASTVSNRRI